MYIPNILEDRAMRYQYPEDVERFMDQFSEENPNAGWRDQRAFEQAMIRSMREGGDLYEKFAESEHGKR
jgi:hypothetical protein